jgi:hypothetical protein
MILQKDFAGNKKLAAPFSLVMRSVHRADAHRLWRGDCGIMAF